MSERICWKKADEETWKRGIKERRNDYNETRRKGREYFTRKRVTWEGKGRGNGGCEDRSENVKIRKKGNIKKMC